MNARKLAAGAVAVAATVSHVPSALAQAQGYKAYMENSDITKQQYPPGWTQYFDQSIEQPWGILADHNPCYVYGALACYTMAPPPPVDPPATPSAESIDQMAADARKILWLVDNDSQTVIVLTDTGAPQTSGGVPISISVPGKPTGIAPNPLCEPVLTTTATGVSYQSPCNGTVSSPSSVPFVIHSGGVSAPAVWLAAGRDGRIYGWNPSVSVGSAIVALDTYATGADYTGITVHPNGNMVVVSDFHNGRLLAFDSSWNPVTFSLGGVPAPLVDPNVPAGYAPSNAQFINYPGSLAGLPPAVTPAPSAPTGTHLYVTWAQKGVPYANVPEVVGPAAPTPSTCTGYYGYVSDFVLNGDGTFSVTTLNIPSCHLNAPWGIALAPTDFGVDDSSSLGYELYIGNFGDGYIDVVDPVADAYLCHLGEAPSPIVPPANVVPGTPTVGTSPSVPAGTSLWEPGLRGLAFKKIYYQVTPVPLAFDYADRLFFNANYLFKSTNDANEWSTFGYLRPN